MNAQSRRIDGIVLSMVDFGERDRIVRLICAEHGRIAAIARGCRGSRKRFGGALDIGNRVDAQARRGRGDLWTLDSAETLSARSGVRADLLRMALCTYACEYAGALAREEHPELRLFGLLETYLTLLDAVEGPPPQAMRLAFESKALTYAGLTPRLDQCARCALPIEDPCSFSSEAGGALHARCAVSPLEASLPAPAPFLRALESLRRRRLLETLDQGLPQGPRDLLQRFAEHHLGHALRSAPWMASLDTE